MRNTWSNASRKASPTAALARGAPRLRALGPAGADAIASPSAAIGAAPVTLRSTVAGVVRRSSAAHTACARQPGRASAGCPLMGHSALIRSVPSPLGMPIVGIPPACMQQFKAEWSLPHSRWVQDSFARAGCAARTAVRTRATIWMMRFIRLQASIPHARPRWL